ncbi:isochorismatase family protein [Microbacterium sp. ASV49]|uniref:Isochorismatase family protein n=1 Tax=Microbacterium candidum TaxID=3041922 RepID=A0ABT7MX64_9MICO|nr:isochorismatase family protein [Microbacterium sp. ASV49]MDL9979020.1 isochorismatase family protein [Microbacterium sp. ASV49]
MTVTTLDPRTAFVVIDLQQGIAGIPAAAPLVAPLVANAARLADAFRAADLPVVLVNVTGGAPGRTERPRPASPRDESWADLLPELHPDAEGTLHVTKQTWGAFHSTDLDARLRDAGVTQIVLAGIATSAGVESTARAAHEHGYNVTVATDAVGDMDPVNHEHSLTRVFPRLGETGTSDEILDLLAATAR